MPSLSAWTRRSRRSSSGSVVEIRYRERTNGISPIKKNGHLSRELVRTLGHSEMSAAAFASTQFDYQYSTTRTAFFSPGFQPTTPYCITATSSSSIVGLPFSSDPE